MIEHLSYSSISMYLACPESWRRKYIANEPTYASTALVFGGAVHNTVEDYIQGKGDLVDMWIKHWKAAIAKDNILWGTETPEEMYNEGVRILMDDKIVYNLNTIPKPSAIELRLELQVPGVPVPVVGFIDMIGADGIPADLKTSSSSWSQGKAAAEIQPLFYLAAMNQNGLKTPGWRFRHYVIVKTKIPKFETHETSHLPGEMFFLFDVIQRVWRAIESGIYPPNPMSWKCSAQYCDYWGKCRGRY